MRAGCSDDDESSNGSSKGSGDWQSDGAATVLAPWVDLLNHSSEAGVCLLPAMPFPSMSCE